jgi:hypothetical protein
VGGPLRAAGDGPPALPTVPCQDQGLRN